MDTEECRLKLSKVTLVKHGHPKLHTSIQILHNKYPIWDLRMEMAIIVEILMESQPFGVIQLIQTKDGVFVCH